jgi:chorismate mutase
MSTTISPTQPSGLPAAGPTPSTGVATAAPGTAVPATLPASLPATELRTAGETDLIPLLRTQIDAIDAGVTRLIAERARLSRRIQTARIAAGGVRVELGRERRILAGYRAALGEEGVGLATAVLRLCRGPL